MRYLDSILENIGILETQGPGNPRIRSLAFDSRKVGKGDLFAAVPGTQTDGHQYIGQAVSRGAIAVLCESLPAGRPDGITFIRVENSARALGLAASNYYGSPSEKVKVVGVTGTNGKTTVASLLYQLFGKLGRRSGMISTIGNRVGETEREASHTTPDAIQVHGLLAEMLADGCSHCFMEVSSHAIHQQRIAGISFAGGIFTNITHDHLDYHDDFSEYVRVKKSFFDAMPGEAFAITNLDDRNGKVMVQNCRARVKTYGLRGMRDFKCRVLESHLDGMQLVIDGQDLWTGFAGTFNAYNLLAVYAAAVQSGIPKQQALVELSRLVPVKGRFEILHAPGGVKAIVDYAHTPDALKNILTAINQARSGTGILITVMGAGGNRDAAKRPMMGRVAAELSNRVILTSDNPRDEEPGAIIREIMTGIPEDRRQGVLSIPDRREAIKTAAMLASGGDIILVAGKGHETYQEIKGTRTRFDDREILEEYLIQNRRSNADLSV